jgi:hypothetical protein
MAGSSDRLTQTPERIAERSALIPPIKQLLNLPVSRREQREALAEGARHELATIIQQYPQDKEQIRSIYTRIIDVQKAIGFGNVVIETLVKDGEQNVFRRVQDQDARVLLSIYYANSILRGVAEKGQEGIPPIKDNVYAISQNVIKKFTQALGVKQLDHKDIKRVTLSLVVGKILEGQL